MIPFLETLFGQGEAASQIGGVISLPSDVEGLECGYCSAALQPFFKIDLGDTVAFNSHALVVLACVACAAEGRFIPPMIEGKLLHGVAVPSEYLKACQKNFRFVLLPKELTGDTRMVRSHVARCVLQKAVGGGGTLLARGYTFGRVGGTPEWQGEDEAPGLCDGQYPFEFIFQLEPDWRFALEKNAPKQRTLDERGRPTDSESGGYELFVGNSAYFFATNAAGGQVYVVTQRR